MQLAEKPKPTRPTRTLLLVALVSTLVAGSTSCARTTRTVVQTIPCIATPPPMPPPEDAGTEAMSWWQAALVAWSFAAWDSCKASGALP